MAGATGDLNLIRVSDSPKLMRKRAGDWDILSKGNCKEHVRSLYLVCTILVSSLCQTGYLPYDGTWLTQVHTRLTRFMSISLIERLTIYEPDRQSEYKINYLKKKRLSFLRQPFLFSEVSGFKRLALSLRFDLVEIEDQVRVRAIHVPIR